MNRITRYIVYLLLQVSCIISISQNETKKWYFGNGTGLDFMTTPPSTISVSSMNTTEGCASIADNAGNMLFYTNGVTIWDQTHALMVNGTGLIGHVSTSQSSIILPKPGSSTLYYVITNVGNNIANVPNVYYSIVDMSLASGNGSVTVKNVILNSDPNTEMLSATRHCNGTDWWIVVHIRSSSVFLAFLLSSTGINLSAVPSSVGPNLLSGFSQMKFSPNGRKIAMSYLGAVYVGDFDNATGVVSGITTIQNSTIGYGCEFSPDGRMLYAATNNGIMQYNLCAGSTAAITSSGFMIYTQAAQFASFQLAPDGKIYITYNSTATTCHVINNPNLLGPSCNFAANAFTFLPRSTVSGLPNIPGCYFYKQAPPNPFFVSILPAFGCYGAYFDATVLTSTCVAMTNSISGVTWDFGDPVSGPNNISYLNGLVHNFSGNGTYTVTLYVYYTCAYPTDTVRQTVVINDNCLTYNSSTVSCASLGTATITSVTGVGPFTYTWLPGTQTGSIANNLTPGSHTVVVNDSWTNFTYSVPIILPSATSLTANINALTSPSCNGGSNATATIGLVTGGTGSQSYFWNNGVQTSTLQSPTNLSAGNWTVTVTDNLSACNLTSVVIIPQPTAVSPTITPSSYTACCNTSVTLVGTASGGSPGYTYTWTNGPASPSTIVSESVVGLYNYVLLVEDLNLCPATKSIAINFLTGPTLSIPDVSICPNNTGTLIANGATSYSWNSQGSPPFIGSSFTDTPVSTTQYTIVGSSGSCTSSVLASIIIFALPNPTLQSNSPICDGETLSLSVSGGSVYYWSGPMAFSSPTSSVNIAGATGNNAGTYSVSSTSANGCVVNNTLVVVVNPIPTVSASGSTVCVTQAISLFANAGFGSSYSWTGPLNFVSSAQSPTIGNSIIARGGVYNVKVISAGGCTNSANAQVQVVAQPVVLISTSNPTICFQPLNGSLNTITVAASGAANYTLYPPAFFSVNASGSTMTMTPLPPFLNNLAAYTATVEGSNGICATNAIFNFSVIPNPTISINSSTPAICVGESFTLTTTGASSYLWNTTTLQYNISNGGSVLVSQPIVNASYSVIGSNLGCNSTMAVNSVTVKPLPVFTLTPNTPSICLNEEVVLFGQGTGNTYQWSPSTGLSNVNGAIIHAKPLSNQLYSVVVTANGCLGAGTVFVTVLPLPTAKIEIDKEKFCLNDNITLHGFGGVEYRWYGPGDLSYQGQTVNFIAQRVASAQQYSVTVIDLNGCRSGTVASVEVLALPSGDFDEALRNACVPFCERYHFSSDTKGVQSIWEIDQKIYSGNQIDVCYEKPGTYTISGSLLDASSKCLNHVQYVVEMFPKPSANFMFSPIHPIENIDEVKFTNTSTGEKLVKHNWFFNDNKGFVSSEKDASFTYYESGVYRVVLVTSNEWHCADTILKTLTIESDFAIYVPNAFTPNGDEINDVFLPVVRSAKKYDLKIFDRWGHLVFGSTDFSQGWDGSFKGEPCKQDVYNYFISVFSLDGKENKLQGTVSLIR